MRDLSGREAPAAELRLQPLAQSVRAARVFLRERLREAGREEWTDAAELALSEVVTNGVLHAHTELVVRVAVLPDAVQVEVADASPTLPSQRREHDSEATTGRGLELVAALTRECGVRAESAGKVIWFTVTDDPVPDEVDEEDLLAAWDVDDAWDDRDPGAATAPDVREVVLLSMPTVLWGAAREHHQALLRELVLYVAEHHDSVTAPDMVLADQARHLIWNSLVEQVDALRAAEGTLPPDDAALLAAGPPALDLRLAVPVALAPAFGALQDALDVGEQLAVADRLLARPALPEIIAVRDWACEQVVAQLAGVPASPWPGSDQSAFTEQVHDRADPAPPQWDATLVTGSDRGVVAADDANRIIAISDRLARTVGWEREEIVGRRVVTLIPPELREAHVAGFSRHLTTGHVNVLGASLTLPVLRKDGSQVRCSFLLERAPSAGGRAVYVAWIEPTGD